MTETKYRGASAADDIIGPWVPKAKMPPVIRDYYRARDGPQPQALPARQQAQGEQEHLTPACKPPPEWRAETDREVFALKQMKLKRDIALAQAAAARYAAAKQQQTQELSRDTSYTEPSHEPSR